MTELLVAVTLLAALLALAGPALGTVMASVRLNATAEAMVANLQLARSEAIKRNTRVVFCSSPDGEQCAQAVGWERGGMVFQDTNNNGVREPSEPVIFLQQAHPPGLRITGNSTVASFVSYSPDGLARHAGSGAFQAGTITVCAGAAGPTDAKEIVLNSGGRVRVQKSLVESCP